MELQRTRIFLLISLFVVALALYSEWQREHVPVGVTPEKSTATSLTEVSMASDIPHAENSSTLLPLTPKPSQDLGGTQLIEVSTDVLKVKIDTKGGDLVRAELLKYPKTLNDDSQGEVILEKQDLQNFVAQTGLVGKEDVGPDSRHKGRAHYTIDKANYELGSAKSLNVNLHWQDDLGLEVTKTYTFHQGSYLVDVAYHIRNNTSTPWQGSMYGQLQREFVKKSSGMLGLGVQTNQGAALSTAEKPFKKVSFSDMKKHPVRQKMQGGWAAMLEHYFLCAYIPQKESTNHYYTRLDGDDVYNIGATTDVAVLPQSEQSVGGQIYIGPEIADELKVISPGLNLTVDYGILWPISLALFWLLKNINHYVGNWGWSIIFVTVIIKAIFYKLSASSYRSMGKMRSLQPKIEALKKKFGDDKQQFSAAMMDLYRKDKINPLGGCLPIIIQIPVFIALYYVLLESIELRHAPFMLWIQDLSGKDPYYVLPLIMGVTMFVQQKLNPAPPDPIQAKVMMLMPVIFTVLFLSFPAGLVLYWTVNNILSIAQQWYITRALERETTIKKIK